MKDYTIDAKNRSLGRVASEVALVLAGKKEVNYVPHRLSDVKVKVINIDKIKITGKKIKQKQYQRHSGYPGGLKIMSLKEVLEKKGMVYVFRKAVMGMLPKNKLRNQMIKNLEIYGEK